MSALTYNDVRFHLGKSASVEFDVKYDKTNTDVIANVSRIRYRGVASLASDPPADSSSLLPTIRHMLNQPRRNLLYQNGGATIFNWQPLGNKPDAMLGPRAIKPAAVDAINPGTFFIDVGYEVCDYSCGSASLTDPVTSLRWSQSESFNETWYSTITTSGTLTVRADLTQCADNFRSLCVPPVLPDYQRVSSKYTLAPDGLSLDFEFVDQEKSLLPPYPAVKAKGRFTVQTQRPGIKRVGVVDLTLEGAKGASRKDLMFVALNMAYAKIRSEGFISGTPMVWGSFSEDLFEPVVTVSVQANLSPLGGGGWSAAAAAGLAGAAAAGGTPGPNVMRSVGYTPGTQDNRPGIAPPVRKRLLGLLAAAFKDPCAASEGYETELRNEQGGTTANPRLSTGFTEEPPPAEVVVGTTGGSSPVVDLAPYDLYFIHYEYTWDTGARVLPGPGVGPKPGVGAAVTLHGGSMRLEMNWYAQRTGTPPVIPAFLTTDTNLVPIGGSYQPAEMQLSGDGGSPVWRAAGHYVYGVLDPSLVSMSSPLPPMLAAAAAGAAAAAAGTVADVIGSAAAAVNNLFLPETAPAAGGTATPPTDDIWNIGPGGVFDYSGLSGSPGGLSDAGGSSGGLLPTPDVNP